MRLVVDDSVALHTVAFGRGPQTLLAVGGWIGSWELWQQPFELLPDWRTIGYDHRGAGESVVPTEAITLDALVADVFTVLDAYDVERCVLAGESHGSIVALLAALSRPERFSGLVLVAGGARWRINDATRQFREWLVADEVRARFPSTEP